MSSPKPDATSFEESYPHVAGWGLDGWIELGPTDWSGSCIRVMDEGGLVWEGQRTYARVDDAFAEAEQAIEAWHSGELYGVCEEAQARERRITPQCSRQTANRFQRCSVVGVSVAFGKVAVAVCG